MLKRIEAEISLGTFEYARYFPNSKLASKFGNAPQAAVTASPSEPQIPSFAEFSSLWKTEKKVEWRRTQISSVDSILKSHLLPVFGPKRLHEIDRASILAFRSALASPRILRDGSEKARTSWTVNRTVGLLRQILDEGAARYTFINPCLSIKRLKNKKSDIEPFNIDEVRTILSAVRADYKNYLTVRFFTGIRSGEANGLKWKHIDFERRQILIRETYHYGYTDYTKNNGSQREVIMSQSIYDAFKSQQPQQADPETYVFCNRNGGPIDNKNFDARVWQPLLRHLGLKKRRPYQMRHTCATLWLAAGENPEWIARQLGHTTTEMLFRVYSRFIPNLTRQDGSAFDRLVTAAMNGGVQQSPNSASGTGQPPIAVPSAP